MRIDGACMERELTDGGKAIFSQTEKWDVGDMILIWFRPECVPRGKHQGIVKRLTRPLPHWVRFPFKEHPESELQSVMMVESLNPRTRYLIACGHVLAVHKLVAVVDARR